MREIVELRRQAEDEVKGASSIPELQEIKTRYLGRKGLFSRFLRELGKLPETERPVVGSAINSARGEIERIVEERFAELEAREMERRLKAEQIDVTLPGRTITLGKRHVLYSVLEEIEDVFVSMGFEIASGPEVEYEELNFDLLNIPRDHPARDMQDSFYITESILLRTHTSPVQIRYMRSKAPELPVKIIAPGRVFRRDNEDASHSSVFHQVEGLLVDRGISMADLKGALLAFARSVFGPHTEIRLRPSYFPFTEPSAEVELTCVVCGGKGCKTCKGTGWLEILGCGMVHPQVLRNGGYDPDQVTGFAFGMGVERIAMLKYGIDDIRLFYLNDKRFLEQFSGGLTY